MGIIGWIVLGLIAGAIAKAILPGDDPGGIVVTTIIGIAGALLGGFLAQVLFNRDTVNEFFDLSTWLTASILLVLYRLVSGRRRITYADEVRQGQRFRSAFGSTVSW
ncbi:MAG TPA: GlsB/YeaQ/YmgE family stress response membrane protein [Actinomycetes bacterium]|jgi:uncharacterized membrane protein YeaQ/YmgE (transglycosylase-associated protein family)|nr:GlsB/YeaQ/YmgE family stress response membrane protein [Actinomycetes bacterium]